MEQDGVAAAHQGVVRRTILDKTYEITAIHESTLHISRTTRLSDRVCSSILHALQDFQQIDRIDHSITIDVVPRLP